MRIKEYLSVICFSFCIFFYLSENVNAQQNCANAEHIPIENYGSCGPMAFTNVSLEGATPSGDSPNPTCGTFNASTRDVWYSFTVPAGVTEMAFHAFNAPPALPGFPPLIPGSPPLSPGMAIYTGTCGSLTEIDCFSANGSFIINGEIMWEVVGGLTPGTTVYIRLWDQQNNTPPFFFAASVLTELPEASCSNPPELSASGCNILAPAGTVQAPETCGWNSTDNVVFYHFTVNPDDPQPYTITIEHGECWSNESGGIIPDNPEIQFAVYQWNGNNCNGIGGSPGSDPPNNSGSYMGCANGTGTVVYSQNLPPGQYVLAMDGFSHMGGNSLCTFGITAPGIDPDPPVPGELIIDLQTFPASCGELGSASITIIESCSGNPTVNWSTGATGLTLNNLAPGNYSVTVSDSGDCNQVIQNFTIADDSFFNVNITTVGNTCSGPVVATANVEGADPANVTFAWNTNPPLTGQVVEINQEGVFTVTATYGTCSDTDNIQIQFQEFDFTVLYTEFFCQGTSGSAIVNIIEGVGPFYYDWSPGAQISPGISFTQPGMYTVTVLDSNTGCEASRSFEVYTYPQVNVSITKEDITCFGKNDGTATAVVSGGTPEFTYQWSIPHTTPSIYMLSQGNYGVTVTDANGCMGVASTTIGEPTQFTYSISQNQGICYGEEAEINVVATGGTPPYSYTWNDAPINSPNRIVNPFQTTTYTVTVLDANSCTYYPQSTTITVSEPIIINPSTNNPLCHGLCTGSVSLEVIGGTLPFFYNWEKDSITWQTYSPVASNLCAGNYSVTITDMFECNGSANFVITQPDSVVINSFTGQPTCNGYSDGYAYVEVFGGTPFTDTIGNHYYNYNWSYGGIAGDSIAINGGYHNVTITDANNCSYVEPIFVQQPEAIFVTNPFGGTICIGQTFTTTAYATGGTIEDNSAYNFIWTAPPNFSYHGPVLQVNPENTTTYTLHVTDDNGCFGNPRHVTVYVHPPLNIIGIASSPDYICIGETVTVEIEVEGGNGGPYTYYFNNQSIVNNPLTFYPPASGYYTFRLEDECGSPNDIDSTFITVHPLPHVSFYAQRTTACPPGNIQFYETTQNPANSYLWSFGDGGYSVHNEPLHTYQETGLYTVSLTAWSEFGCERKATQTNMIRIYPKPRAEFTANPENASILNSQIQFRNLTDGGSYHFWDFGDGSPRIWTDEHPTHTYQAVGEYDVTLITKNMYDCPDTITKKIRIFDEFAFYAPTAFTPNGDGINDYFYVTGHGIDPLQFQFSVYDRNGMRLYETDVYDIDNINRMAWDGTANGNVLRGDPIVPNGTYVWYCSFIDVKGKPHQKSGLVTLIR